MAGGHWVRGEKNIKPRVRGPKIPLAFWGTEGDSDWPRDQEQGNLLKWEYCEVIVTLGGEITGNTAEAIYPRSDGEHERVYEANFGHLLARIGEEGWELVSAHARPGVGFGDKHRINYLFKRPIPET